uniref:F-box domain and ankyrin repeat protein n=1 Tax=Pithovirus LCPAC304 TaxID=2506594 RepID=A0A481Z825_9VIRU|nr:MAG: F-box domain and ankyrin repeat protein [Pithovirus LCPAC304]
MDLSDLTVVNLRKLAKENGLKGYSRLGKAELIDFLETNLATERLSPEEEVFLETDPSHLKPGIFDLMELPYEMRLYTLAQLRYPDLMRFCATSKAAAKICLDNHFWGIKTRRDFGVEYAYTPWPRENWEEDYRFYLQELEPELMDAVYRRDVERVRELAEFGVDVNSKASGGLTMTPLMYATMAGGSVEIATILLDNGADILAKTTRDRITALIIATMEANVELVKFLLDHGADAQATDRNGEEAINRAADINASIELVDVLLEGGADINNIDHRGFTLLRLASQQHNNGEYIQALLDRGADINSRDTMATRGYTPLLAATVRLKEENVRVLLENGADISIRDNQGSRASDIAGLPTYPSPAIRAMLVSEIRKERQLRDTIRTIIEDQGGIHKATKRTVRTKLRTMRGQEFVEQHRSRINAIIEEEARDMAR